MPPLHIALKTPVMRALQSDSSEPLPSPRQMLQSDVVEVGSSPPLASPHIHAGMRRVRPHESSPTLTARATRRSVQRSSHCFSRTRTTRRLICVYIVLPLSGAPHPIKWHRHAASLERLHPSPRIGRAARDDLKQERERRQSNERPRRLPGWRNLHVSRDGEMPTGLDTASRTRCRTLSCTWMHSLLNVTVLSTQLPRH